MNFGKDKVEVVYDRVAEKWCVFVNDEVDAKHDLKQDAEKDGRQRAKGIKPSVFVVENKRKEISYQQHYN